jgi:hypothetical protein
MSTHLVQLQNGAERRVALVEEPGLRLLEGVQSVHELATRALAEGSGLCELARRLATGDTLDYETIYNGASAWILLPPIDHPEPSRCLVSGTGLTHLGSAKNRQAMHEAADTELTDSMRMFRWGVEGGKPGPGRIGTPPEWFYKGPGGILRAHGEPIDVPAFAEGGGEEAEVAGIYLVDGQGQPLRIGMATGNEFSDHVFERKNYLNLAGSKMRPCALGPELVLDPEFDSVRGTVAIRRAGDTLWTQEIATGEAEMCHSLANIEHHHFKFESHRRPGDVHVHYFGAHSLSFGAGIRLESNDEMIIAFEGFGRPLRNTLRVQPKKETLVPVSALA